MYLQDARFELDAGARMMRMAAERAAHHPHQLMLPGWAELRVWNI
jgi:hypothetical protein